MRVYGENGGSLTGHVLPQSYAPDHKARLPGRKATPPDHKVPLLLDYEDTILCHKTY